MRAVSAPGSPAYADGALRGITVEFADGEQTAIVGSGACTLLAVLAGEVTPAAGIAEVGGRRPRGRRRFVGRSPKRCVRRLPVGRAMLLATTNAAHVHGVDRAIVLWQGRVIADLARPTPGQVEQALAVAEEAARF